MELRDVHGKAATVAAYLYLILLIAVWLALWLGADRWTLPTLLAYGPRWVFLLPLGVLLPVAVCVRRRRLFVALGAAGVVGVVPIMGCRVPLGSWGANEPTLRVLTCNVGGPATDAEALSRLIRDVRPDIVLLQECGTDKGIVFPEGWNVARAGQLQVATPFPIGNDLPAADEPHPENWPPPHALAVTIETPLGRIAVCDVHLRTSRRGIEPVLDRRTIVSPSRLHILREEIEHRRRDSEDLARAIARLSDPVILAGDFNMPPDSTIYSRYWGCYANAFSEAGWGFGLTRWATVCGLQFGVRIDHILVDSHWRACHCWVGSDVGSDHLPVVADLGLREGSSPVNQAR